MHHGTNKLKAFTMDVSIVSSQTFFFHYWTHQVSQTPSCQAPTCTQTQKRQSYAINQQKVADQFSFPAKFSGIDGGKTMSGLILASITILVLHLSKHGQMVHARRKWRDGKFNNAGKSPWDGDRPKATYFQDDFIPTKHHHDPYHENCTISSITFSRKIPYIYVRAIAWLWIKSQWNKPTRTFVSMKTSAHSHSAHKYVHKLEVNCSVQRVTVGFFSF